MKKKIRSAISAAIIISLLADASILNSAFAQRIDPLYNQDSLSVPSRQDDIMGMAPKDILNLEMWFRACLIYARKTGLDTANITAADLRRFHSRHGKDIFNAPGVRLLIGSVPSDKETDGIITIKVRLSDKNTGMRSYYIEYNPKIDAVNVYPEDESKRKFTTSIKVPKGYHPDLKELSPSRSGGYPYKGRSYSVGRMLVPKDPDRIFTPAELFDTGTYQAEGQKRLIVESDDMMTFASADILTSIMDAASYRYTIGLATGGTTEALRKLLGLADMIKSLYGRAIDADKIKKICTLDNYYFMDYLKRNGFTPEEAKKIIDIASYESEQLYMMIENLMGGDVKPGFFIAPSGLTNKSWFESAEEFRGLMAKFFCIERFVQLWQLHGIGTNSHDAFNEIYARLKRDIYGMTLRIYKDGSVKKALLKDGTDLVRYGLNRIPSFNSTGLNGYTQTGMLRDDYPSLISFIVQVQNNGHFLKIIRQIFDKRYGDGRIKIERFHPFFLKFMGDNSLYDVDELITAVLLSTPEQLLRYTSNPKFHFKDMEDFVAQLQFLLEMYSSVPEESTTQGVGEILRRGSIPLPDGNYTLQLVMACALHKQLGVLRALQWPSDWSTSSVILHMAKNAILVATEESLGMVTAIDTMDSFIKVRDDKTTDIGGLQEAIEDKWGITKPGRTVNDLLNNGKSSDLSGSKNEAVAAYDIREKSIDDEIGSMKSAAEEAGFDIAKIPDEPYTLMLPFEFYRNNEFNDDSEEYGEYKFERQRIGGDDLEGLVKNILGNSKGKETRSVALIPKRMVDDSGRSKDLLKKLADSKIRFILADIASASLDNDKDRRHEYRSNTYAIMLLTRYIDEGMEGTKAYRLLGFYLRTHFGLAESVSAENYIEAIKKGDVSELIKSYLAYRPSERYDAVKEYHTISASLIFA